MFSVRIRVQKINTKILTLNASKILFKICYLSRLANN